MADSSTAADGIYVDMDGNPVDLLVWGAQFEDFANRVIATETVDGRPVVTVLIGHNEPEVGVYPFGTAIQGGPALWRELAQYHSRAKAEAGHRAIVAWLQAHPDERFTDEIRQRVAPESEPAT